MSKQQQSKFPEKIGDLESIKDLNPATEENRQDASEHPKPAADDDPRVNISTADDVDIEPDEEEQSDEPAPPIVPPEKV